MLISRDKHGGVMETRLSRELDSMLVESYLNLDCSQLDSTKVVELFKRVYSKEDGH